MNETPPECELEGIAIVALGSFNPAIFQPFWFASNNLIRREEAEAATVEVVHQEISVFTTEWCRVQVQPERLQISTTDPTKYRPLRDLVVGVFKILEHMPVSEVGLNSDAHFSMASEEQWHALGHYYAPKATWLKLLDNPGLLSLKIQGRRPDCQADKIELKIDSSSAVRFGVVFHVHQHYQLKQTEGTDAQVLSTLFRILDDDWDDFLQYRDTVTQRLLADFSGNK